MKQCLVCLGLFSGLGLGPGLGPAQASELNEPVVSIDQEPSHRMVLSNDVLRIFDVAIEPGTHSLFHRHDLDSVLVCLDGANVPSEEPGQPIVVRPAIPSDQTYYRAYAKTPLVHRIHNISPHRFRILDIEILSQPTKEGELALAQLHEPGIVTNVLENDRVRVSKISLGPEEKLDKITFNGPHLFVFMSKGKVSIGSTSASATPMDMQRGLFHYVAQAQSESVHNLGSEAIEILVVEVKHR
jgi:hypothetical protein